MKRIIIAVVALAALGVAIYGGIKMHRNHVVKATVIDSLKQIFNSGADQRTILNDLRKMGPNAMPATIQALSEPGEVGSAALLSLMNNPNTKNFLPDLVSVLESKNPEGHQYAAVLIGINIRPQDTFALPALIKALSDTNEYVRGAVAGSFRKLGPGAKIAVPALTKALDDSSTEVRIQAASALFDIDSSQKETVIPILNDAMANGDARDSYLAAYFLYKIDPQNIKIIPVFISSLTNKDLRINAANSLRLYGSQASAAVPALLDMLKSQNLRVQQSARAALEKISPESLKDQTDGTTP